MVPTLCSLDFLRPLFKILLVGNRNHNVEIPNHLLPQARTLPDAERSPEQDMVVTAFSKRQARVERWALSISLLILRCSTAVAVFKLASEIEGPPEGRVIPPRLILNVLA